MPMQKIEFEFPDEKEDKVDVEIEKSSMTSPFEKPEEKPEKEAKKADKEVDIEVVDDTPLEDRGRKPSDPPDDVTEEELGEYSEKVQKRIKKFSKGYHDERRAKEQAQRERDELENLAKQMLEENKRLKSTVGQSQSTMFEHAKQTVEKDLATAKRDYKEAYEAGDADRLLKAQEALNLAQFRTEQLKGMGNRALQQRPNEVQQEQQGQVGGNVAPQQAPQRTEPDTKARAWANENTWFGQDQEMTALALGTHAKLVESGIDPTSDEYYEKLNFRMHQVFPEQFGDAEPPPQEEYQQKRQVVAPATRSTTPKKVRLTQTQVALAKKLGISIEDYAKQVAIEMRKANG